MILIPSKTIYFNNYLWYNEDNINIKEKINMANCCDGKKPRKIKEWGTENKENKFNGNIKLLAILGVVVIVGIIVFKLI